jgi:hypothetical protein
MARMPQAVRVYPEPSLRLEGWKDHTSAEVAASDREQTAMPPLQLEPLSFPEIAAIEVAVEEQQDGTTTRHCFTSIPEIPERFPPSFGSSDQHEGNMLYLGNRVREAYEARQREAVFREPYTHTAPTGTRQPVNRSVTIRINYSRPRPLR